MADTATVLTPQQQATQQTGLDPSKGLTPVQLLDYNQALANITGTKTSANTAPSGGAMVKNDQPKVSTTTISNANKLNQAPSIISQSDQYAATKGITTDASGVARYPNGSIVPTSPQDQYNTYLNNGGNLSQAEWQNAGMPTTASAGIGTGGADSGAQPLVTADTSSEDEKLQANLDKVQAESDAYTASIIESIKSQYDSLIRQQGDINDRAVKGTTNALLMGGVTGGGGSAQYAPISSGAIIQGQLSYGLSQIADLNAKEDAAIATAKQAQLTNNIKLMEEQNAIIQKTRDEKVALAQKQNDLILEANQKLADQKLQATKDEQIGKIMTSGVTDPAEILKQLRANGITTITAKDITDTIANLNPNQKAVTDIMAEAAKNGASKDIISAIGQAKNVEQAISAAGMYLQSATGEMGDYLNYKRNAVSSGLTPLAFDAWQKQQDQRSINQKSAEAYATQYAKNKADLANGVTQTDPSTVISANPDSQSILSQTGLTVQAFNFLTQGTSALTRMTAAERQKYMNEANAWLNKNGIDISTFQSQYKAYNNVVEKNIERANNTKIFSGEVTGTVDQFLSDVGNDFGKLKAGNIAKLFAGEQVNDPTIQKYAFNLHTMQNDLAGYYAASRGDNQPNDSDLRAAAEVIKNGMSSGSAQAFKDSITSNEEKVTGVVNKGVDTARQQVWNLFGVGSKFKAPAVQVSPDTAKKSINDYITSNPADAEKIAQMYSVPGATDVDIYNNLKARGIIK